ncbi:MAG: hypothetical protein R3F07_02290 [Opitutaceae bacterium]
MKNQRLGLRALWGLITLILLFAPPSHAQTSDNVVFQIGEIPPQRVWYSDLARIRFEVKADILGEGPTITATFNPDDGILGSRTFDPETGLFTYIPNAADAESFQVSFAGDKNGSSVAQSVTFTPLRPLPPETSVFGLKPKGDIPDPESNEFLDVETEVVTGNFVFNAGTRTSLRNIVIVGKTVVFEENHPNELWGYHANEDIQSMTIHAETLIVRGALSLPQTQLAIYATEVRFEDKEGAALSSISTKPKDWSGEAAQYNNGIDGHDGGTLTLFTDAVTAEGSAARFILDGGKGQKAGRGAKGADGKGRSTYSKISNGLLTEWSWKDSSGTGTVYVYYKSSFLGKDTSKSLPSSGDPGWPENGKPATPGGRPGRAGNGGAIVSNGDYTWAIQSKGSVQGEKAAYVAGGTGGSPRTAYKRYFTSEKQYDSKSHYSSNGAGAYGRDSDRPTGSDGDSTFLSGDLRWLSPPAMEKVLIHLKQAYLNQHFDFVRTNLDDYIELLELAMATDAWADLEENTRNGLTQILDELRALQHRIGNNLDYFGNPAGWVPMLSFEVNKLAFENEIPRALRVMYLNYWLGDKAETIADKIEAMTAMREQLKEELKADRDEYTQVVATVPGLEFKAQTVQTGIDQAKIDIESIKNDLIDKAKNIALLKKTAKALGAVAEIFPVGQPYVGLAGSTLSQIADADPDAPLEENALIIGTNVAGDFVNYKMTEKANAQKIEAGELDLEDLEAEQNKIQQQKMRELQGPIMDVLGESLNQIRNSQSPTPEVEAELQRLLADEPAYKEQIAKIKKLNKQKVEFAVELAQTMQQVVNLTLAISKNLIIVDVLNRNIQDNSLVLDAETLSYLDAMNQRARDRLLKYHYFMARAYEYRMLKPYDAELDLTKIFDKFQELATYTDPADKTSDLTPEQFESLQAVYEDQISSVVFSILDEYNSNRPALSAPVRISLSQKVLDQLNTGQPTALNLYDEGLFLPDQENLRIYDLQVIDLDVDYVGDKDDIFYSDIIFQHSGVSSLQKEGETYLFRHYNEETRNKIEWGTRFDPFDGMLDPIILDPAEESLLKSLLSTGSKSTSTENLLLYSRPAAKADLILTKQTNSRFGADTRITRMRVELVYSFSRTNDQIKKLKIVGDEEGAQPLVKVSKEDLNQRQNGEGSFERSYDIGSTVTLEAPAKIGQYVFDGWKGTGVSDPDSPITTLILSSDTEIQPVYRAVVPYIIQVVGGTGSGTYINGETIQIAAAIPEGYKFVRWEGAGVTDPNSAITTLTVSSDSAVEAIYAAIQAISTWLGNISTRAQVGTGADILIPGFVIEGEVPKKLLIRAIGPKLADFGVTGFLQDPILQVLNSNKEIIGTNDNWETAANLNDMLASFVTTGAFDLPSGSKDASALVTLVPGAYTVKVSGVGATTGVSLVEVYDADGNAEGSRLVNISGRAQVGVGADVLIPGFVVDGDETKQYLIRAIGPTLAGFNVNGFLEDPTLTVFQDKLAVATNDDWQKAANLSELNEAATRVGAFNLVDGSKDAAALVTLDAGRYTIKVSGVGGTSGVALVEVYEVVQP